MSEPTKIKLQILTNHFQFIRSALDECAFSSTQISLYFLQVFFNVHPTSNHQQILQQFILKLPSDPTLLNNALKLADQQLHDMKMLEEVQKKVREEGADDRGLQQRMERRRKGVRSTKKQRRREQKRERRNIFRMGESEWGKVQIFKKMYEMEMMMEMKKGQSEESERGNIFSFGVPIVF